MVDARTCDVEVTLGTLNYDFRYGDVGNGFSKNIKLIFIFLSVA
jgi:hypothetical protein